MRRKPIPNKAPLCACGCNEHTTWNKWEYKWNIYIKGHNRRVMPGPMLGHHHTEETKRKIRESNLGWHHTAASRKKMSASHKCVPLSLEHRKHIGLRNKGKIVSEETRKKISIIHKGKVLTKEAKQKMREAKLGKPGPWLGKKRSAETIKKMTEAALQWWSNPENKERELERMQFRAYKRTPPTKPEISLLKILFQILPYVYKYVGNWKLWIGSKNPDFIDVNGRKKVIELFGDYWHGSKVTGISKKEHRIERQEHFAKYGYQCCVVWEHELKDLPKLRRKLYKFHAK